MFAKLLGADGTFGNDVELDLERFFLELRGCTERPTIPSGQPRSVPEACE